MLGKHLAIYREPATSHKSLEKKYVWEDAIGCIFSHSLTWSLTVNVPYPLWLNNLYLDVLLHFPSDSDHPLPRSIRTWGQLLKQPLSSSQFLIGILGHGALHWPLGSWVIFLHFISAPTPPGRSPFLSQCRNLTSPANSSPSHARGTTFLPWMAFQVPVPVIWLICDCHVGTEPLILTTSSDFFD